MAAPYSSTYSHTSSLSLPFGPPPDRAEGRLAILGGRPAFERPLHVGRPNIGNRRRLLERINEMLDRRWLSNNGVLVQEFERRVAECLGVRHCIATCNGTMALQIAIQAAGLTGEVIVPSMTFIATAHALKWQRLTPVFCDISADTHTIDPARVEQLITRRTSGILGVHLWGRPCAVDDLTDIARRHELSLLFDAAHAFGCTYRGDTIGRFGAAEVLSFHATKFLHAFEGGAVVTNDDELAGKARGMKNFGYCDDTVTTLGINGKMSEVSAAMGLTSLESFDEFRAVNRRNHDEYRACLERLPGIRLLSPDEREINNYQYVVVEVDRDAAGLGRDDLLHVLHAENIFARRYFHPGCHRSEPYCSGEGYTRVPLTVTEAVLDRVLVLPTGTTIEPLDIATIASVIGLAITRAPSVRTRLAATRES